MFRGSQRVLTASTLTGIAVFAILVAGTFLRQTGIPKWQTAWAEDGRVFVQCAYDHRFLDCLTQPYEGYLHVVPRIGAAVATAFDPGWLPFNLTLIAALVAAACGLLVARAVSEATRSRIAGLLAGTSLVLVWAAGREVSGNLANLHWILLAASIVVLTSGWLARRIGAADIGLLALTAVSSAFALVLPVFGLGAVLAGAKRARLALGVVVAASIPQLIVIATSQRDSPPKRSIRIGQVLDAFRQRVIGEAWFGPHLWDLAVPALLMATIIGLALMLVWHRRNPGVLASRRLLLGGFCAAVVLPATGTAMFVVSILANAGLGTRYSDRYAYEAAVLTVCAIAIGGGVAATVARGAIESSARVGRWSSAWTRHSVAWGPPLVAILISIGFALSFRLVTWASSGPDLGQEITAARSACASGAESALVTISPRTNVASDAWQIAIPCARLTP